MQAPAVLPRRRTLAEKGVPPLGPAPNLGGEGATSSEPGTGELFALCPCSFFFFLNFDSALPHPPSWHLGAPSADQENIDAVIKEVARDAEAEANKIAAEEASKGAAEDAAKEPVGETGKAAAEEAGKAAAEEGAVDHQPSSSAASGSGRYLKVSDDLFVHLPGTVSE